MLIINFRWMANQRERERERTLCPRDKLIACLYKLELVNLFHGNVFLQTHPLCNFAIVITTYPFDLPLETSPPRNA